MSSYSVRKRRWLRRVKQQKRRNTALFMERLKALEEQKELDRVDSEQIHDLLNQLEFKVNRLSDEVKVDRYRFAMAEARLEQRSWWYKFKRFLMR